MFEDVANLFLLLFTATPVYMNMNSKRKKSVSVFLVHYLLGCPDPDPFSFTKVKKLIALV
jgi:hypothetical protein